MIHDPQHTITAAKPLAGMKLALAFGDGYQATVDLGQWARRKPLRALADAPVFQAARVDARGGYVIFIPDDLELAADNLRELAEAQAKAA